MYPIDKAFEKRVKKYAKRVFRGSKRTENRQIDVHIHEVRPSKMRKIKNKILKFWGANVRKTRKKYAMTLRTANILLSNIGIIYTNLFFKMDRLRNLTAKPPKPKNTKWKAKEYYIMGLTAHEVEKLTGINKRTLERYMKDEDWRHERAEHQAKERQKIIAEYLKEKEQTKPKAEQSETQKQQKNDRLERIEEMQKTVFGSHNLLKNIKKAVRSEKEATQKRD